MDERRLWLSMAQFEMKDVVPIRIRKEYRRTSSRPLSEYKKHGFQRPFFL